MQANGCFSLDAEIVDVSIADDWKAFDALPALVREAVASYPYELSCEHVLTLVARDGADIVRSYLEYETAMIESGAR